MPTDEEGRVADFHALRHTHVTQLSRTDVSPKIVQSLVRHSTITLTMDRYAHVGLADESAALATSRLGRSRGRPPISTEHGH
ncbi:MAG: tyrosine-type recombinase/integrase [Phycisphaerales bacterium]